MTYKRDKASVFFKGIVVFLLAVACNLSSLASKPLESTPALGDPDSLVVNTYADTLDFECTASDCSLRDAIYVANLRPSHSSIVLPGGIYRLTKSYRTDDTGRYGDLDVFSPITIYGHGIDVTTIDGDASDRIFHVFSPGNLELHNLTLINGNGNDPKWVEHRSWLECVFRPMDTVTASADAPEIDCGWGGTITTAPSGYERKTYEDGGGALAIRSGSAHLYEVSIVHNVADNGAAIRIRGGRLIVDGGFLCFNEAERGGGIYNINASVTINRLGFCENEASDFGSAIYIKNGDLDLRNATFGENAGSSSAGTIYVDGSAVTILNATFFKNEGPAIINSGGAVTVQNSILANYQGVNCTGKLVSYGNNLETGDLCGFNNANDQSGIDVQLSAELTEIGGVYTPYEGSPAIDGANVNYCPAVDQEGDQRPQGLGCDIGADEVQVVSNMPFSQVEPTQIPTAAITGAYEASQPTAAEVTSFPSSTPVPSTATPPPTQIPPTMPPANPPTSPPPDPSSASISGIVWEDTNGNGSKESSERGIAGTAVYLGAGSCPSTGLNSMQSGNIYQLGLYSFTGLPAGTYCVSVQLAEKCNSVTVATTPTQFSIQLSPDGSILKSFGFQKKIC